MPDGEHVDLVRAQVAHHAEDLVVGLAQADHQARFGGDFFVLALEFFQQGKRVLVIAAGTRLAVEPRHGLEVVVHHVGRGCGEDPERALQPAAEIRHKNFYSHI